MAQPSQHQQQTSGGPFGDTTYTKIFVGGLAWETQRETMRRYFDQFGEIQEAVVIRDKSTGRSKGYGFVTFKDAESAQRACQNPSPVIDGRRANCNLASLGASTHNRSRPPTPQHGFRRFRAPSPAYHASSTPAGTAFFHQPAHYPLPFSVCGYSGGFSPENVYPMSYYGTCGGGHGQFSPYYAAGTMELGVFHSVYPYYPQMLQYPYLPPSFGGGILSTPVAVASTAAGVTPIIGAAPSLCPGISTDQKPFS